MGGERNDVKKISRLPPEVWLSIFRAVQAIDQQRTQEERASPLTLHSKGKPKRQSSLLSLNATCALFRLLAQPLVFEKVAFGGNSEKSLRKASELVGLLDSKPEYRDWVREVVIDRWIASIADQEAHVLAPVFERVGQALLKLNNIRHLLINHTTLTYAMYAHLYKLSELKTFVCWNISVAHEEQDPSSEERVESGFAEELDTASLSITSLTFYNMHAALKTRHAISAIARLALSPHLQFLHLSQSVSAAVFSSVGNGPGMVYSQLETLELSERIEQHNVHPFFTFLTHCPSLSMLRVASTQTTFPVDVSPSACPNLRSFGGSLGMAELIVQGRPVSSIRCFATRGMLVSKDTLGPLTRGTVPLLELDIAAIRWNDETFTAIAESFPGLTSLTVWYENDDIMPWIKEHLPSQIKALPSLRLLFLCGIAISLLNSEAIFNHPDREIERGVISQLAEVCPHLSRVRLQSNEVVWLKDPVTGGWVCQKP